MEENSKIEIKRIRDHIYLLDDAGQSTGYVVIGSDKALVIDTMNGDADVKEAVRSLTGLPLMVVNTHGHCDHIFGNVFFEEAYLHPADRAVADFFVLSPDFIRDCESRGVKMPPFSDIRGGEVIDLGGITVEIIELPGHTPGSILLLDREDRILFTGDAVNRHLWLQLDHSLPLEQCLENLKNVLYLEDQADVILHGHAKETEPVSLIRELCGGLAELCDGRTERDTDYQWFGGPAKMHTYGDGKSAVIYPAGREETHAFPDD